jgi:PTH1 family peptidyl-tRNA hydrolase
VVSLLSARWDTPLRSSKERALVAEAHVDGELLVLAFPQTFVNLSGESAARLVRRYGIAGDMGRLVVVHDEMDLPVARVKVKEGGGTAGHNGLESVRTHLHSGSFVRVRIGVGRPPGRMDSADYVLRRPAKQEQLELDVAIEQAADAVEAILAEGPAAAMNRFNA